MKRCSVVVRGGRDLRGDNASPTEHGPPTRGQDIGVFVVIDGRRHLLPVSGFVLRVDGRRAIATLNLLVDEVEITGIENVDTINIAPKAQEPTT